MLPAAINERQQAVLSAIRDHIDQWGVPPTRSELAKSLGYAHPSGVDYSLRALARHGMLKINPGMDRGLQLLREGLPVFDLQELPAVGAGQPLLVDESKAIMRIPPSITERLHPKADLYLVVHGSSMTGAGYRSGDIVAVQRKPDPNQGDIVVARLDDAITLKRFHRKDEGTIELQPQSTDPEHKPIVIDQHTYNWEIVGIVVGAMTTGAPANDA